MPAFPKPNFVYNFDIHAEIQNLKKHKNKRHIPEKTDGKLLIATWNIANLGLQKRWNEHYKLIAEIISWFDIIAIQETNDNLEGLYNIELELPNHYDLIFSDAGGNNERFAFIFDNQKIDRLQLVAEISIPPKDHRHIKLKGVKSKFTGFDRTPYLCSFQWKNHKLIFITVHSYFGSERKADVERRSLEAYAISRYADLRKNSKYAFSKKIITMGDFNIPKIEQGDQTYDALMERGLKLPDHSTQIYSNINDDKQYDQIAFLPSLKSKITANGVFDFDTAIFPDLWESNVSNFKKYLKYYMSDHRPMWIQLKL
ncbi:endonuclease/exonuclease/phosphatase family protein [Mariniflexile gromovii]|uniref:Endonuclease/exonuclease/phosphatase family protein n=1 Tax=Mariniflexile gromovii TaxID=362523 RepID=A0ABS4BYI6_9FLAO|nr:endonuclease/exonuclease/phosphatase family protein [Mariniflexile gromovii]MBP0905641.1 endonuclease/exonuclease/phosphatase family protein [Mariniflexile gromovii]